eukprot:3936708-Rhodomonas_salina.2
MSRNPSLGRRKPHLHPAANDLIFAGGLTFELQNPKVKSCLSIGIMLLGNFQARVAIAGTHTVLKTHDCFRVQCKPQVQKTGTVYLPFCVDPRRANLEVLKVSLVLVACTMWRRCLVGHVLRLNVR